MYPDKNRTLAASALLNQSRGPALAEQAKPSRDLGSLKRCLGIPQPPWEAYIATPSRGKQPPLTVSRDRRKSSNILPFLPLAAAKASEGWPASVSPLLPLPVPPPHTQGIRTLSGGKAVGTGAQAGVMLTFEPAKVGRVAGRQNGSHSSSGQCD